MKSKRLYTITLVNGSSGFANVERLSDILNKTDQEIYRIIQDEIFDEVISLCIGLTYRRDEPAGTYFITRIK